MIEFDNDDEDQDMRYDCVLKYAYEDAGTFHNCRLQADPIPPPEESTTRHNEIFVIVNKLDWIEIFEDANHPAIPDMTSIPFTGEREEFDVDITEEEINSLKRH